MTLQQLKYVITAADNSSMSEAAKALYISQPSLTNAIHDIEQEAGITIFSRTNKGIRITPEGSEFLGYARQVVEQSSLLEARYMDSKPAKPRFSVSTQHYSFAVNAFVELLKEFDANEYDLSIREIRTCEIIEDVSDMRSEVGILYLDSFNEKVITRILEENDLEFTKLFSVAPHIFISTRNPLSAKKKVTFKDLEDYPYLCFEHGSQYNSFYFSEEMLSTVEHKKKITVSDRATLFNLLIGSNGYTISSGVIDKDLNGEEIIALPLDIKDNAAGDGMRIGYISRKNTVQSRIAKFYVETLEKLTTEAVRKEA